MALLVILLAGQALASMDGSIMAVAAPSLRADLHASGAEVQLVVAMYLIGFAALVIIGARVGEIVGRRRAFIWGLAGFSLASLVGGLAPTPTVLILARGAQGAAGALLTPQVLGMIQVHFSGEARARAIAAYSLILAVGVAVGQVLGGLLVGAHLLAAAWRPALLVNGPACAVVLLAARRWLPESLPGAGRRLDLAGSAFVAAGLLSLVIPLTLGREAGWPVWVWPALGASVILWPGFVWFERRALARRGQPLFDVRILAVPGVAAGALAIAVLMGCYGGFLLSLTLHLQNALHYGALHAGLTFAVYAAGFATASLAWPRLGAGAREWLSPVGTLLMGGALVTCGAILAGGQPPGLAAAALLFAGGVGHACGYSPLANRLTGLVGPTQVTELSGLLMISALIGQVLGVAAITGVYLGQAAHGSGHALVLATRVALVALAAAAAGSLAIRRRRHAALAPVSAQNLD